MVESNRNEARAQSGLGLLTLSALVVANMIGAGVFTSSGFSLGALGSPARVMLAWWLCGVWAMAGAIAYGALARRLPLSGGEYLFLSRLVHPSIGFLAGWISVVAGFTAPIAVAAQGAAIYGLGGVESGDWRLTACAVAVIAFATTCHLAGMAVGAGLQNAIVIAKLLLLAIIIIWAFGFTPSAAWQGRALPGESSQWWPEDWAAWTVLAGSMSWVALSYTGFNAAIYVAGQAREPHRTVPQSMLVATAAVTVIYLLLNYIFVYAPSPESIANQNNVADIAAMAVGGTGLSWLLRVTIVLAMTSSVFAMLLAGPRVYQKMAEDGVMPSIFKSTSGPPRIATVVQALLSIVAVFMADLLQLMKYLGLTLSACGALAVLSLWWARRRIPSAPPLRWWETLAMSVYLLITFAILWASRTTHSDEFMAMLVTFALGGVVYGIWTIVEVSRPAMASTSLPSCPPYELREVLSYSAACEVYLARDPSTQESVVIKLLPTLNRTALSEQRWRSESDVLSRLVHPHVVRLIDSGRTPEDRGYLALEHVPGSTLWDLIQQHGSMPQQRALPLLRQIASAVAAVHEQGFLHGDLAPKNIVVSGHHRQLGSATEQIKLIDFGLARSVCGSGSLEPNREQSSEVNESICGTPAFMSPESCQGRGGGAQHHADSLATDIYSFGCLAFFMLTGQLPFNGSTSIEICWKQIHQPAPIPSDLGSVTIAPELEALILRCLEKSPEKRPLTMQDVVAELSKLD